MYYPGNGRFYVMGGRTSDAAASDLQNPAEYNPATNTWTTKAAAYADNQVNNMAGGVVTVAGVDLIVTVGGSAAGATTATAAVRLYNPILDVLTTLPAADNWPGNASGTILPGGYTVANNKLYIIGGFDISTAMTNQIWEYDPNAVLGSRWTQKINLPVARGYVPTTAIGGMIYTAGGSDFVAAALVDTADSFRFDPTANTISAIANIPRATAETRALTLNGKMWVLGGGRTAPNPSTEVDIYDPVAGTWSVGLPFTTARRNFPAATDGSHIYLTGGYAPTTATNTMEIYTAAVSCNTATATVTVTLTVPASSPTATNTASPTCTAPALVYGVTTNERLVSFASNAPGTVFSNVAITGLQSGETTLGIDFRPATSQLYALGSTSRLYTLDTTTGVATMVGTTPFTATLSGTAFGFDFNPVVDRIRVVSNTGQNLRLNPSTGAVAAVDTALAYPTADPNFGITPNVVGAAYTNSFSGTTTTTLYDIDSGLDSLATQNPPNNGTLNTVGSLGVDSSDQVGFDIEPSCGQAFASLTVPNSTTSQLYRINVNSGVATLIGTIGSGLPVIRDISVAVGGVIPQPTNTVTVTRTSVAATATATVCSIQFSDVQDTTAYYYQGVYYLACHGVISGYSDGTYKPFNNTTRAQMTKIVTLAFNLPLVTPPATGTFADVDSTSVFYQLIETAAARGIVSGYTCGGINPQTGAAEPCTSGNRPYFRPSNFVTRGQLAKIVVLGAGWPLVNPPTPTFTDVPRTDVFYQSIETAACRGIISGYSDNTFRPNNYAFRGQIAKIVYLAAGTATSCGTTGTTASR